VRIVDLIANEIRVGPQDEGAGRMATRVWALLMQLGAEFECRGDSDGCCVVSGGHEGCAENPHTVFELLVREEDM
jgi:hypothetical protein